MKKKLLKEFRSAAGELNVINKLNKIPGKKINHFRRMKKMYADKGYDAVKDYCTDQVNKLK